MSPDLLKHWSKGRFKGVVSPARPNVHADKAGGTSIAVAARHQSCSFRHLAAYEDQTIGAAIEQGFVPGPIDFWDFTPISWRLRGRNLVPVMCYLTCTIKYTGDNITKMNQIGSFVRSLKDIWVLAGDFNLTPEEMVKTGWLDKIGGTIIVPHNTMYTCTAGQARILDYIIIPTGAEIFFRNLLAVEDGAWTSHLGLELDIDVDPLAAVCWSLRLPQPFPHPPLPKKQADPNSKTSRSKATWTQQRDPEALRRIERRKQMLDTARHAKQCAAIALRTGKPPPSFLIFPEAAPMSIFDSEEPEHEDAIDYNPFEDDEDPFPEGPVDDWPDQPELEPEDNDIFNAPASAPNDALAAQPAVIASKPGPHEADYEIFCSTDAFKTPIWNNAAMKLFPAAVPPSYIRESAAYGLTRTASDSLAGEYANWVNRMESFYNELYSIEPTVRRTYAGRARLPELTERSASAQPVAALTDSESDTWWAATAANLALYARMKAGKAGDAKLVAQAAKLTSRAGRIPAEHEPPLSPAHRKEWDNALRSTYDATPPQLRDLAKAARGNANLAAHAVVRRVQADFTAWCDTEAEKGSGKLHKLAKPENVAPDEYIGTLDGHLTTTTNQKDYVTAKRLAWASRWDHEGQHQEALLRLLHGFRQDAIDTDLEPITVHNLTDALRSEPKNKSRGLVQLSPEDIIRLPTVGKQTLVDLLNSCEANAAWPWQFLAVAVSLIPKKIGDRGLGIIPWIQRLWIRIRSCGLSVWVEETADPWDDAVAGGSALRQALRRSFLDESAHELGRTTASSLWDVKEFFDHIDMLKVLEAARLYHFPPTELVLLFLEHLAPRLLRIKGAYAPAIHPHRSAIAGCRGSQQFARIILKRVLYHVHSRFSPALTTSSWIDDVNQRTEGHEEEVVTRMVQAGISLARGIKGLGLVIADKSRVVASNRKLAKKIASRLSKKGIPIQDAATAADLGIDRGSGVVSSKPTDAKRYAASLAKATKFAKLARTTRRGKTCRRLFTSGVIPQAGYSAKIYGMPPSKIMKLRTLAGSMLNNAKRGRCLTTRLALDFKDTDPGINIPMSLLTAWLDFLIHNTEDYDRIAEVWPGIYRKIR